MCLSRLRRTPVSPRLVATAMLGLALLIMFIRSLTYPSTDLPDVDEGLSYGTVIVLLAVAAATAGAALGFKESGDKLPKIPGRPA